MFRTRDFVLLLVSISFLVVAISMTVVKKTEVSTRSAETLTKLAAPIDVEDDVQIYTPDSISRAERLAAMRSKIAADQDSYIASYEAVVAKDEIEVATGSEQSEISDLTVTTEPQLCINHVVFEGGGTRTGLRMREAEGARVFYRELVATTASGTPLVQEEVVLQLPANPLHTPQVNCLTYDVVGIAKDGSFIRNNETALYSIFSSETLIGYALDGFPIYGAGNMSSDACGGATVSGQYGYYLNTERETVLSCFSAQPVVLN